MKEYKIEMVAEGALGTILFGSSKFSKEKVEETLNTNAKEGWNMDFMVIEQRRLYFFWKRETVIITFSREK